MSRIHFTILATLLFVLPSLAELPREVASLQRSEPVDFVREIQPILKRSCLACHFEQESEGGLNLESHEGLLTGGDSGPGIAPKNLDDSLVWLRATGQEEPLMPPEDNGVGAKPLTPEELGLLRLWIEQGAPGGEGAGERIDWQAIPETIHPVYAAAVSPDGQWLARGRGNSVEVFDLATGERVDALVDEELSTELGEPTTDVDLVQSIAISPWGDCIATGGFRTVKIWRKSAMRLGPADSPLATAAGPVCVDATGHIAAFPNAIGDIEVWDLREGERLRTILGTGEPPVGLSLSADGDELAGATIDGAVTVWDTESGRKLAERRTETSLRGVSMTPDGSFLATLSDEGRVGLWRIEDAKAAAPEAEPSMEPSGRLPKELATASIEAADTADDVRSITTFVAGTPHLATGHEAGQVTLWDLATGEAVRSLQHEAPVDAVAVNASVDRVVTGSRDGSIRLWKLSDGNLLETLAGDPRDELRIAKAQRDAARQQGLVERLTARTKEIEAAIKAEAEAVAKVQATRDEAAEKVAEQEQNRQAAAAKVTSTEQAIKQAQQQAADAREQIERLQEQIAQAEQTIETAGTTVEKLTAQLERDRKALEAADQAKRESETALKQRDRALQTAQNAKHRVEERLPQHEQRIADASRKRTRLDKQLTEARAAAAAPARGVAGLTFRADGKAIASTHRDGTARVYRLGRRSASSVLAPKHPGSGAGVSPGVIFAGDGILCHFGWQTPAEVWRSTPRWQLERVIGSLTDSPISDRATAIDFRPDGLAIAVGSGPPSRFGDVKLFSVRTGRLLRDFGEVHSDTVFAAEFSPDGQTLATAGADKAIRLHDLGGEGSMRSLEGHTHHVLSVGWQDNGETLASASADQSVKTWNVETGGQRRTIGGFPKEVTAVEFVAAGNQLVSVCADGQVRVHDSGNGKLLRSFRVSDDFLFALDVTPDGKTLIAGGQTGSVQVWNLAEGKLLHEIP